MPWREKVLKITLTKSPIGYSERQKQTVKALGLGKMNSSAVQPDNPQIRGMVRKVSHLVEIEQVDQDTPGGKE
ncbi:MAG TPA: 50S ribosomal protein L30 [Armatimonadota bacterium]|nr:50S ribosomal protein L30 [Armatimonadota bacterium]